MCRDKRKKGHSKVCCGSLGKKVSSICVMAMGVERSNVDPSDIYNTWYSLDVEGDSLSIPSRLLLGKLNGGTTFTEL